MKNVDEESGRTAGADHDHEIPLYNSRIVRVYIDYLLEHHPDVDIDEVLELAGIASYAVDDQAHWLNQNQVDGLNRILVRKTGNANIARDAGRYAVSSGKLGAAQQYTLGLMSLSYVYLLMGKLYGFMSRGAAITTKRLRSNKVEIVSRPSPGVNEKPYQCQNRIGIFESLAKLFTNELAHIAHPMCLHRGHDRCVYIVTWKKNASMSLKPARNLLLLTGLLMSVLMLVSVQWAPSPVVALLFLVSALLMSLVSALLEKRELTKIIAVQGDAASELLAEINIRHANSALVQEIGQTLSRTPDINELTDTVVRTIVRRTKFDRALIMLANRDRTRLVFQAGYGYSEEHETTLKESRFRLDNPDSKGPFVLAFKEKTPYLIEDINKSAHKLSLHSRVLAKHLSVKSLICAPILFENEALGVLVVDNEEPTKKFDESDLHLVMGVASQTASGIANANYFRQLEAHGKEYRQLVESAQSIILRMDLHGNITFFNEFAERLFGYSKLEILGKNILTTIHVRSETTIRGLEDLIEAFRADPQQSITGEHEHVLDDGRTSWITWTYSPIFDENKFKEILCIGSDITALKRASQEKQQLEIRLRRAEKMEAIGTLAGGVAHDLNNILAGIVTYPEALLMELPPDDTELRKPHETITEAGKKAAAIVQDLLTLARRGVTRMEAVDFNEVVLDFTKGIVFTNIRLLHTKVELVKSIGKENLCLIGSKAHLSKVIMNLITNAAEAMPDGGTLTIMTRKCLLTQVLHGYEDVPSGVYAVLAVEDTGIGIPPEDQGRIFEPFFTKKVMARSGTGLGMAVVWGTVKDHDGFIDFQSTVGKGTAFQLYFPLTEQVPAEEKPFVVSDFMGNGETILVVDDAKDQRDIAFRMLTKLGYKVAVAQSGRDAEQYLREKRADLLLLDMIMEPDFDGLDTYRQILDAHPGQKALIASGFSETDRVRAAQMLGAGAYLKKPYSLSQLATAVKEEIRKPLSDRHCSM